MASPVQFGADRLADHRARAVAADQVAAVQPRDAAGVEIAQADARGAILDHDVLDRGAVDDADARVCGGMLEQDRFEKNLVDAVRRLRRRPVAIRTILHREAVAAAGNRNARQFRTGESGAVADVVRIIRRQSGVAHLFGDAEPPEDFHGAGGDMVAFRLRRLGAGARLHHGDVDAAPGQIDREREPDRSGADDQHIRLGSGQRMNRASANELHDRHGFCVIPVRRPNS